MSLNYEYLLQRALASAAVPSPRILDYGCGSLAPLVTLGTARGIDIYGVDLPCHQESERFRLLDSEGRIAFDDHTFDVVVSNQVFEHIAQPRPAFGEIARVLKPGGTFIAVFPDNAVWFEGHLGLYFVHWLMRYPRLVYCYLVACHKIGLGYFRDTNGARAWADRMLVIMRTEVFYASARDLRRWLVEAFGVEPESLEHDWMLFRIAASRRLRFLLPLARQRWMAAPLAAICRIRAGCVLRIRTKARVDELQTEALPDRAAHRNFSILGLS
jgi:SAM-dependent methyltransferase